MELVTICLLTVILQSSLTSSSLPPPCPSEIFCHGQLLHTIQMASLFPDSKTFVDMKMKQSPAETLKLFKHLMIETTDQPNKENLTKFLEEAFEPAGSEFEDWTPGDWHPKPEFLEKINDRALRKWAENLHNRWKLLGRKMKDDVIANPQLYSIIPVKNPVIVPGGRFREFYYWDSYWIIRGLLLSEMRDTVKGMLLNFVSIVQRYGMIPNGGRIYYLMRSQPPLLIPMVDIYYDTTNDYSFLKENIQHLEREFQLWMNNHTVEVNKNGKVYHLCRYSDSSAGPRPESYREDVNSAQFLKDEDKDAFYSELKTAAESGWDFSTRWMITAAGTNQGNLTDTKAKSIVPVDLNAIIYGNARVLSKFYRVLNNTRKADLYNKIADDWLEAVTEVLWHEEVGIWLDYDLANNVKRDYFYPSNFAPLWTGCYHQDKKDYYLGHVFKYIFKSQLLVNLGGTPSSLVHSGEQWDYPNAWPPLQYIVIMGLDNTDNVAAQLLAAKLAERWVHSNYLAFEETGEMYEKYDATVVGGHGGGGEYEVQLGFGWSNGIIMELLQKYGDVFDVAGITNRNKSTSAKTPHNSAIPALSNHLGPVLTLILAFGATFTAGCIGAMVYAKRQCPVADKASYMRIPATPNL